MKNSIVIAQVGKSAYRKTAYKMPDASEIIESNYSFEAVIRYVLEIGQTDSVNLILVATKDSSTGSVYRAFSPEYKGCLKDDLIEYDAGSKSDIIPTIDKEKNRRIYEQDMSAKMEKHFQKETGRSIHISVTVAIIGYGLDNSGLQRNFNIIRDAVEQVQAGIKKEESWDVYFDISNGFRSFPIYIYALINYLSRFGSSGFRSHLLYGMYDAIVNVINNFCLHV